MARDYLNIGSSPPEESCAQVGSANYHERAREECRKYMEALRKKLGPEPEGARLQVKSFPHDFGSYYEVVCHYDSEFPDSEKYALACESHGPMTWDDLAPYDWRDKISLKPRNVDGATVPQQTVIVLVRETSDSYFGIPVSNPNITEPLQYPKSAWDKVLEKEAA